MSTTKKNNKTTKTSNSKKKDNNNKTISKNSKSNKKKTSFKEFVTSTKFLMGVFIALLILVIILGILCFKKSEEVKKNKPSNMNVHVKKVGTSSSFDINAAALASTTEYIFRITNYDNKINTDEIKYTLTIVNDNDCEIEVTKNDDKNNLIINQKETKIEGTLSNKKKEDVYYHVKIVSKGKIDSRDLINVKIDS